MNFSMASTIQGDIRDISQTIINASNISSIGFKSTPVQSMYKYFTVSHIL